jgi:hypothetical protein
MPTPSQRNTKKREEKYYPPAELKKKLADHCKTHQISKSKFMVGLIKEYLKNRQRY